MCSKEASHAMIGRGVNEATRLKIRRVASSLYEAKKVLLRL